MPSAGRNLWDMNHIYGSGYMYLCASYYQSKYPGKGYEFFNRGISGNALADLEKRWVEDARALMPEILSVLVGTNVITYYIGGHNAKPFCSVGREIGLRALAELALLYHPHL